MFSCYQQCRLFSKISLAMCVLGFCLPLAIAFSELDITLSPATYNFLQFGGTMGAVVFYFGQRLTRESDSKTTRAGQLKSA